MVAGKIGLADHTVHAPSPDIAHELGDSFEGPILALYHVKAG